MRSAGAHPHRMPFQHDVLVHSTQHVLAHLAGQLLDALCLLPRSGLSTQQARRSFRGDAARGAAQCSGVSECRVVVDTGSIEGNAALQQCPPPKRW